MKPIDPDCILTPEEEKPLNKALKEYKLGKTVSLESIERGLKDIKEGRSVSHEKVKKRFKTKG